jgi:uncharacterized alkaline shock family protein YloU
MPESRTTPGKTTIAPDVLLTIARLTALNVPGVSRLSAIPGGVNRLFRRNLTQHGVQIEVKDNEVTADIYVALESGVNIREVSRKIQHDITRAISKMVGMEVGQISIHIEDIDYPDETE